MILGHSQLAVKISGMAMSKDNKMEVFVDYFKHELAEVLHHNISLYMDQMLLDLVRLIGEACFSQDRHVAVVMLDFVMAH